MKYTNSVRKRVAVLAATFLFAGSVFGYTVLAAPEGDISPIPEESSSSQEVSSEVSSESSSEMSSETSSEVSSETSSEVSSETSSETSSENSSSPSSSDSSASSSSSQTSSETSSSEASSQASSSYETSGSGSQGGGSTGGYVDTQQSRVEGAASQIQNQDPDVNSNTDWSDLLNSGTTSGEESSLVSQEDSETSQGGSVFKRSDGGFSWILFWGCVLLVLGVCGIGLFVYLQWIRPRRVHHNTLEDLPVSEESYEAPDEFEDISSYSQPEQMASEEDLTDISGVVSERKSRSVPEIDIALSETEEISRREIRSRQEEMTASLPQEEPSSHQEPAEPQNTQKPSEDFDWEQFFQNKK